MSAQLCYGKLLASTHLTETGTPVSVGDGYPGCPRSISHTIPIHTYSPIIIVFCTRHPSWRMPLPVVFFRCTADRKGRIFRYRRLVLPVRMILEPRCELNTMPWISWWLVVPKRISMYYRWSGFGRLRAFSTQLNEPLDAQRDGFLMKEGAAVVILERSWNLA